MSLDWFRAYHEAIEILEAREKISAFQVSAYPMMKKESAEKLHKDTMARAFPGNEERRKRSLTTAELARLSGAGIIREKKPHGG